jgi:hypothetical protein
VQVLTNKNIVEPHCFFGCFFKERNEEVPMQKILAALSLAVGIGIMWCQIAGAVPQSATGMREAVTAASPLQKVQYREFPTRHSTVKCYRDFVFGPYRCHHFRTW